jgi:hypothetical protein
MDAALRLCQLCFFRVAPLFHVAPLTLRDGPPAGRNCLLFIPTQPLSLSAQARLGNELRYIMSRLRRSAHRLPGKR